ncbi:MAG TPA: SusC/RagA family TonB-linked outer membrane protein, partial [Zunongwangia profunda]|nr:SusC/RagA family TonB-linked outer membrane protein [Zunongwangia profunda]
MEKKLILFALMSIMITTPFFAQNRIISGTVKVSEDNMPLPGVNVIIKGTNNGTVTDMQGKYSLEVTPNAILVFSAIGFVSQEIEISGQEELNVSLVQDTESLDEVVVTALGISIDKKSLGYAKQEVEGEDLNITNQQ